MDPTSTFRATYPTLSGTEPLWSASSTSRDPHGSSSTTWFTVSWMGCSQTTTNISRAATPCTESPLVNLLADAQLDATVAQGAQIAFVSSSTVRANLTYRSSMHEGDGVVTYKEAAAVQPDDDRLVTLTLTGGQIERLLEEQFVAGGGCVLLGVSNGFTYAYSTGASAGDRIDPANMALNGPPVDPMATYRVTVSASLARGRDGFTVLREGVDPVRGPSQLDALLAYLAGGPMGPPASNRVTVLP